MQDDFDALMKSVMEAADTISAGELEAGALAYERFLRVTGFSNTLTNAVAFAAGWDLRGRWEQ